MSHDDPIHQLSHEHRYILKVVHGLSAIDHPDIEFLVTARADVDGDDALSEYTATERQNPEITLSRQDYY